MSTKDYLDTLDLDQLKYAKAYLEGLIEAKTHEKKVKIWRVEDSILCHGNFADSDYLEAVNCLALQAEKVELEDGDDDERSLEIKRLYVIESEAADYLE